MPFVKHEFLTEKEKKLLNAIDEKDTVKAAASSLGISPRTAYDMLYRIRNRYVIARGFINTILAYRKKSPRLEMILTKKVPLPEEGTI